MFHRYTTATGSIGSEMEPIKDSSRLDLRPACEGDGFLPSSAETK
jgi:hypothetical protein